MSDQLAVAAGSIWCLPRLDQPHPLLEESSTARYLRAHVQQHPTHFHQVRIDCFPLCCGILLGILHDPIQSGRYAVTAVRSVHVRI